MGHKRSELDWFVDRCVLQPGPEVYVDLSIPPVQNIFFSFEKPKE